MKTVAIIGPQHCGSTMFFNAARELGAAAGMRVHSCWAGAWRDGTPTPPADLLVMKDHELPADLISASDVAIVPVRHPVDALLTHVKRYTPQGFSRDEWVGWVSHYCRQTLDAPRHGARWISYEFCTENRTDGMLLLCRLLGLDLGADACAAALERVDAIRMHAGLVENDLGDMSSAAHADPHYRVTLTSRSHFTAGGAVDKWVQHRNEPWFGDVSHADGYGETVRLVDQLRRSGLLTQDTRPPTTTTIRPKNFPPHPPRRYPPDPDPTMTPP